MQLSKNKIADCNLVDLSKIQDRSGNITVVENGKSIPFDVKRIYYLYDRYKVCNPVIIKKYFAFVTVCNKQQICYT